ncbi:transcription initiation factor IIB [Haloprofundus halophilus]|uniref:transcription initiation factor IIB n=1 Tax=Haloprofundus halophilus TaxID=2283527 RepID=UPI000E43AD21|nr:TFIIB-type zinc ribbon-containing protein [Haloprofundus halophilus]
MSLRDIYESGFDEESGKTTTATTCPECSGTLVTEGGESSCTECGLIVDEHRLDHGPEWRSFSDDETNSERTGAPLTPARHDRGLSSEIGFGKDGKGNILSGRKRRHISRLRHQHGRARWRTKAEQNLAHACGEITRITAALELPRTVCEEACTIYRAAQKENLIRGRSIETMTAGSVYAACRCRGSLRTISEVAEVALCTRQKVRLGYRVLNAELGLQIPAVDIRDLILRFASECEVSDEVRYRALGLARIAEERGFTNGRNPSGVAAGCLYLACREFGTDCTQTQIARLTGVATTTVRERYCELREERGNCNPNTESTPESKF